MLAKSQIRYRIRKEIVAQLIFSKRFAGEAAASSCGEEFYDDAYHIKELTVMEKYK